MAVESTVLEGKKSVAWLIIRLCIDYVAIIIVIGLWWFVRDIIKFCTTRLTITDKRIMGHLGLVNTEDLGSPLDKITGVKVSQGMGGKMFNYGRISITTAANVYDFDTIANPNKFKTVLLQQIEKAEDDKVERHAKKLAAAMKK